MSKDLIPSPAEIILAKQFAKVMERNVTITAAAMQAPALKRDKKSGSPIRPNGMSDEEYNVICDAMLSSKDSPAYLQAAFRMTEVAQKIAGRMMDVDPPVARRVIYTVEPKEYPVLDITPKKTEPER